MTLPEGLAINPSGANGLDGCSPAEIGYTSTDLDGTITTTPGAATCPDASGGQCRGGQPACSTTR